MSRKAKKKPGDPPGINMTAMIDIVFQLIIFFIFTIKMEEDVIDRNINLALSPNGPPVGGRPPGAITVNVDKNGGIRLKKTVVTKDMLRGLVKQSVNIYGPQNTPVVVVGDAAAQHKAIREVMDACSAAGVAKIKFLALKEPRRSR